jgi:hypothetical protein
LNALSGLVQRPFTELFRKSRVFDAEGVGSYLGPAQWNLKPLERAVD